MNLMMCDENTSVNFMLIVIDIIMKHSNSSNVNMQGISEAGFHYLSVQNVSGVIVLLKVDELLPRQTVQFVNWNFRQQECVIELNSAYCLASISLR